MAVKVRDLTGHPGSLPILVDHSPVMEILVGLQTFGTEPHEEMEAFEAGPGWFDQVRTRAPASLQEDLSRLGPQGGDSWGSLAGLVWRPTPARDVPAFLDRLEGLAPEEVWMTLLWSHIPTIRDVVGEDRYRRAAAGGDRARRELLHAVERFDPENLTTRVLIELEAGETKRLVLRVLRGWHEHVFGPDEDRTMAVLARDVRSKRALARKMSAEALVESATNGLELRREPWVRTLLLVPHIAMRPWNILSAYDDLSLVVYPVADDSLEPDRTSPPAGLIRLHRALGDERRLRMLRRLTAGPATLQELADAAGLAKSSAHHHLVIMRSAGLVRVGIDRDSRYTIRDDVLPQAAGTLSTYLKGVTS